MVDLLEDPDGAPYPEAVQNAAAQIYTDTEHDHAALAGLLEAFRPYAAALELRLAADRLGEEAAYLERRRDLAAHHTPSEAYLATKAAQWRRAAARVLVRADDLEGES